MSIFEYDQEEHFRQLELDAIEVGMEKGLQQGLQQGTVRGKAEAVLELLMDLEVVPDDLQDRIRTEESAGQLSRWLKLAAKAETLDSFVRQMN